MHTIEPFYLWRDEYRACDDADSPFYDIEYSEFQYHNKVYNYVIHPQWDSIGSETLFMKLLFVDYQKEYAIIELIGEWNDCINNDIMFFKREVIDVLIEAGIQKFILIGESVFNFHVSDDAYYEEWRDELEDGWIYLVNFLPHVIAEFEQNGIGHYLEVSQEDDVKWRKMKPHNLFHWVEQQIFPKDFENFLVLR